MLTAQALESLPEPADASGGIDLIIPVLNEEARIGPTLAALQGWAKIEPSISLNIIVVDNGSSDATLDVVDRFATQGEGVEVIGCRRRGKGAAVRAGVSLSKAPFVGYCDADLATPPSAVGAGLQLLASGWQVVLGSRYCSGGSWLSPSRCCAKEAASPFGSRPVGTWAR